MKQLELKFVKDPSLKYYSFGYNDKISRVLVRVIQKIDNLTTQIEFLEDFDEQRPKGQIWGADYRNIYDDPS